MHHIGSVNKPEILIGGRRRRARDDGVAETGRQYARMHGVDAPGPLRVTATGIVIEAALVGEEEDRHRGEPNPVPFGDLSGYKGH